MPAVHDVGWLPGVFVREQSRMNDGDVASLDLACRHPQHVVGRVDGDDPKSEGRRGHREAACSGAKVDDRRALMQAEAVQSCGLLGRRVSGLPVISGNVRWIQMLRSGECRLIGIPRRRWRATHASS